MTIAQAIEKERACQAVLKAPCRVRALVLQVDVYSWVTGQGQLDKVRVRAALKVCIDFSDRFVYPVAHV